MDPATINLTGLYEYLEKQEVVLWNREVLKGFQDLNQKVLKWNAIQKFKEGSSIHSEEVIANLKKNLDDFGPGKDYEVATVSGNPQILTLPNFSAQRPRLNLVPNGIVEISKSVGSNDVPDENSPYARLYEIKAVSVTSHEKNHECTHEDPPWKLWEVSWDKGDWSLNGKYWDKFLQEDKIAWKFFAVEQLSKENREGKEQLATIWKKLSGQLTTMLKDYGDTLKIVDQIICFGLGTLNIGKARSFIQHKAAATVAKALNELRQDHGIETPVTILAQDAAYCSECSETLKKNFNMRTTTGLDGFFYIDRNTFVITFAPTGPICPIIADLTCEFGGPAAMLCDKIESDYLLPEKKLNGNWIDNEPTMNLVKYKEGCHSEDFGDISEIWKGLLERLAMSRAEFFNHEKYSQPPTKKNRGDTPDEEFKLWSDGYANHVKECFPECCLYVRKV